MSLIWMDQSVNMEKKHVLLDIFVFMESQHRVKKEIFVVSSVFLFKDHAYQELILQL